jgi:alkyl hydroperoxide reductase subunit AhpC
MHKMRAYADHDAISKFLHLKASQIYPHTHILAIIMMSLRRILTKAPAVCSAMPLRHAIRTFRSTRNVQHCSLVRQKAPAFKLPAVLKGGQIKDVALSDYTGKWVVLFTYPLDFTFVCPTELIEFSDRMPAFHALGSQVLGVSVDSQYSHLAWCQQPRKEGGLGQLEYPLLADLTKSLCREYGVLLEGAGHSLRATFIIDPQGMVRHVSVNDTGVGRSVDEVLRLLESFQFSDKHGQVCPAGWKRGDAAINPKDSKSYFQAVNK